MEDRVLEMNNRFLTKGEKDSDQLLSDSDLNDNECDEYNTNLISDTEKMHICISDISRLIYNHCNNCNIQEVYNSLYDFVGEIIYQCNNVETLGFNSDEVQKSQNYNSIIPSSYKPLDTDVEFIITRKSRDLVDVCCPFCKDNKYKIMYKHFKDSNVYELECNNCHKKYMVKLDFVDKLTNYIPEVSCE